MQKPIFLATLVLGVLSPGANTLAASVMAREAGYLYLSPVPAASYVSPETCFVLVRLETVALTDVTNLTTDFITVEGSVSGHHAGTTHVATDGRTIIHTLSTEFVENEVGTVSLNPRFAAGVTGTLEPYTYSFGISSPMPVLSEGGSADDSVVVADTAGPVRHEAALPESFDAWQKETSPEAAGTSEIRPNGVSVPSDFPRAVLSGNNNPSPGYLFLENAYGLPSGYTMILDNNGDPVWYQRGRLWDFKVQANGLITGCQAHGAGFPAFDQNFNPVGTYRTVNGYVSDGHELEVLADGGYLIIGYRFNPVDLGRHYPGGDPDAIVKENAIQEFTASGELVFQWRAWDHYADEIAVSGPDFPHMNALDIDVDGHILASPRHLSEITKIDRDTGEILWRLGGVASSFAFVGDSFDGPSWQHDVTGLGDHRYLLFDNGNTHVPQVSRAVEYRLDLTNGTATLVWEHRETPDKYTHWMGSAQRLPNGNTLINFVGATYPVAIEVDTNGVTQFELTLDPGAEVYRVFRGDWTGRVAAPYLLAERRPDGVSLVFNKFGDPGVAHYRIYGGTSPEPTNLLASSTVPLAHITNVVSGMVNYFRVTAVSTNGVESPYSNEESLFVRSLTLPNGEMLVNGDFSEGATGWGWRVLPPASGQWIVTNGVSWFSLSSGGVYADQLQLEQSALSLTEGRQYLFAFDAWSVFPRIIEARVQSETDPGLNYGQTQPVIVTPVTTHFEFVFNMTEPTDSNARVVFNLGGLAHDVYIDNVSLREQIPIPGDFDRDGCVGWNDLRFLASQWQATGDGLGADLNADSRVDFRDFALQANRWASDPFCP